jgi:hypothetical protein
VTARVLTIMGSGETSPTMVKVHRAILARLGPEPVDAVLLDTPFGFQENAHEIAGRAVAYFKESLQTTITVAGMSAGEAGDPAAEWYGDLAGGGDPFGDERMLTRVRQAKYVFAGPGSPTYALRRWRKSVIPQLLVEKLATGGAVTFASAAALTLGIATIPVYEIYKVGEDPCWVEGLDVLGKASGIRAALIPHYNNAEGGTHDTRFSYLGERRLSFMEQSLPAGAFVLGVDEHTSLSLDLGEGLATVGGNGVVTVRSRGRSATFPNGAVVPIAELVATAERLAAGGSGGQAPAVTGGEPGSSASLEAAPAIPPLSDYAGSPLLALVQEQERAFSMAVEARDVEAAVVAILELESQIVAWSADIPGSDELDRAHASLRSMIVELGELAERGARDPRAVVGPFVETLLELRRRARDERRFADSDAVRDGLAELGVEVRDTPSGTEWALAEADGR